MMAGIRGKNTKPAIVVRKLLFCKRLPVSRQQENRQYAAGYYSSKMEPLYFCAWLFLASAPRLQTRFETKNKYRILGQEIC